MFADEPADASSVLVREGCPIHFATTGGVAGGGATDDARCAGSFNPPMPKQRRQFNGAARGLHASRARRPRWRRGQTRAEKSRTEEGLVRLGGGGNEDRVRADLVRRASRSWTLAP